MRPVWLHPSISAPSGQQNTVLKSLGSNSTAATLLDMAELMPDDGQYFVDGYHFNAAGNELRARHTADHLLDNGLLPSVPPS